MNCRRVNSLLSAYIDAELTGEEMLGVRQHISYCPDCQMEHEALLQTKRLLASLATKAPRTELESLLLEQVEREASNPLRRWLPSLPVPAFVYQMRDAWEDALANTDTRVRPNTVLATVALSVVGLWMASAGLDNSDGEPQLGGFPDAVIMHRHLTGPVAIGGMPSASVYPTSGYSLEPSVSTVAYHGLPNDETILPQPVLLRPMGTRPEPMQGAFSVSYSFGMGTTATRNAPRMMRGLPDDIIVGSVLSPAHP